MSKSTIEEQVVGIVAKHMGVDNKAIKLSDAILEDLNADSLDMVEMTMIVEDHFELSISEDKAESVKTVQDFCDLVRKEKSE